ncbi:MAG TPA: response regulator [Caulobacteraceae bacterium]
MSIRILYVDDREDIQKVATLSLELDPEFEVRSCGCGAEAVEQARAWRPDLILLDVMMPQMDGPTVFRKLRELPETADIKVVFITARGQDVQELTGLGAQGVIAKPFDPMKLVGEVRAYL